MALNALLTLDLKEADPEQRKVFNEAMADREWQKIPNITTAWEATFDEDVTRADAIEAAHQDVKECARAAKVRRWHAALQLSRNTVEVFDYQDT